MRGVFEPRGRLLQFDYQRSLSPGEGAFFVKRGVGPEPPAEGAILYSAEFPRGREPRVHVALLDSRYFHRLYDGSGSTGSAFFPLAQLNFLDDGSRMNRAEVSVLATSSYSGAAPEPAG